jgi:hypothetical protein
MAWTNSKVFAAVLEDGLARTAALDLNSDTFKAALYDSTVTPSNTVTSANTAYGAGVWASGEKSNGGWSAGGLALTSVTWGRAGGATVTWDAADLANATAATLTDVQGCLIYDDTLTTPVADQGVCFNYFGGAAAVTSGTLTIVWNASGIATFTAS